MASFSQPHTLKLIEESLSNTDQRLQDDKKISPAFLFAIFLWYPIQTQAKHEEDAGFPTYVANEKAIQVILKNQSNRLAIPKQLQISIRDICFLQHRMTQRHGLRAHRTLEHPRFRAAYDLLLLRAKAGESTQALYDWWTQFYSATTPEQRDQLVKSLGNTRPTKKHRKPRKFHHRTKKQNGTFNEST